MKSYHFNIYIFPSIHEINHMNDVNDNYEVRILFFDASNPNIEMFNTSKTILNPYMFDELIRKMVPIIDLDNLEVCQNNILRIQREFCNHAWSLTNIRIRKSHDSGDYECGHFSQEDINTLKNEIIGLLF